MTNRLTAFGRAAASIGPALMLAPFSGFLRRQIQWQADEEHAELQLRAVLGPVELVDAFRTIGAATAVLERWRRETIRGHPLDDTAGTPRRRAIQLVFTAYCMTGTVPTVEDLDLDLTRQADEAVARLWKYFGA